jgi:hypothetical protein
MELLEINNICYGKDGIEYENVFATIDAVTSRVMCRCHFDHILVVDGFRTSGTVITHKQLSLNFYPGQQLSLF